MHIKCTSTASIPKSIVQHKQLRLTTIQYEKWSSVNSSFLVSCSIHKFVIQHSKVLVNASRYKQPSQIKSKAVSTEVQKS